MSYYNYFSIITKAKIKQLGVGKFIDVTGLKKFFHSLRKTKYME